MISEWEGFRSLSLRFHVAILFTFQCGHGVVDRSIFFIRIYGFYFNLITGHRLIKETSCMKFTQKGDQPFRY
ncbi:unnamed protein product [Arctogadus glacialis]